MISAWRAAFHPPAAVNHSSCHLDHFIRRAAFHSPALWFGFVQIAGYRYGGAPHAARLADYQFITF